MNKWQQRNPIRKQQMRDIMPEPENRNNEQKQPLHRQHQQATQRPILQLNNNKRIAVGEHIPQYVSRHTVVEMVKTKTEKMQHFRVGVVCSYRG